MSLNITNYSELQKVVQEEEIHYADIRFVDILGAWQHMTFPITMLTEDVLKTGVPFDGSSIHGWADINASDFMMELDLSTAFVDPFYKDNTLVIIANIINPADEKPYSLDPRFIATKAQNYLKETGIGDTVFVGPELEFFLLDSVRYTVQPNKVSYEIDAEDAAWNTDKEYHTNTGHQIDFKKGYTPVAPVDVLHDIRAEMANILEEVGLEVETHHHEVATAGQCEIDFKFDNLLKTADNAMKFKYVTKNVAKEFGKTVTFMPKPLIGDNGSGMHCHLSIWKDGKPLFSGDKYAGLSDMALYFIGGILKHSRKVAAITNSTVNSYKRIVPGYEAPVNLAYSQRNRSASIRIPYTKNVKAKRIEVRYPDPLSNPYLAFSALLMAGLDGIANKIEPGSPNENNLYALPKEELAKIPKLPGSLEESLNELEADHAFLTKGGVFTEDFIKNYINMKREEIDMFVKVPHPLEYKLYFGR